MNKNYSIDSVIRSRISTPQTLTPSMVMQKPKRRSTVRWVFILLCITVIFGGTHYAIGVMREAKEATFELPSGVTRESIADIVAEALSWDKAQKRDFLSVYAHMQWDAYKKYVEPILTNSLMWREAEQEAFLISSEEYLKPEYDFLQTIYTPSTYTVMDDVSIPAVAELLLVRTRETEKDSIGQYLEEHMHRIAVANVASLVQSSVELLPDLIPFPAQDLTLEETDGKVLLRFSTIYYNQGRGPLELIADPDTVGIRKDVERDVFQRVYRTDGLYRDRVSGTFLWHQEHLHYHFADFVIYDLEAVDTKEEIPDLSGVRVKSTFCIRDVSIVDLPLEYREKEAVYKICGKEKQGVSVGWGDTYFFTYPDQLLNISDLPSGIYKLSFIVNPTNIFDEMRTDNNTSSITFKLDMKTRLVEILSQEPKEVPKFEHIYREKPDVNDYR